MPRSVSASRPNTSSVRGRGRPATRFLTSAISASMRSASASLSFVAADARAELANGRGDVRQAGVLIEKHRNLARSSCVRRSFCVPYTTTRSGFSEMMRSTSGSMRPPTFVRVSASGGYRSKLPTPIDARACAHGKQHLGRRRDDRDDALRRCVCATARSG